jgi:uncharacterized protein (DUF2141 family)
MNQRLCSQTVVFLGALASALFLFRPIAAANNPIQPAAAATLTITIAGARSAQGSIGLALYDSAVPFPEEDAKAFRRALTPIDPKTLSAQVVFEDVPFGIYAVAVRHDENLNGKLDKNFVGIPREGYDISNNPPARMRTPKFDEAKFQLNQPQTVEIRLIYR